MRVSRDHRLDLSLARFANPARLHVQSIRITVDFDCRARFGNDVENLFYPAGEWRPPLDETTQRVAPDLEYRLLHRADYSPRHLILVHFVTGMNAGNDNVEFFQDAIRIIQRAFGCDV